MRELQATLIFADGGRLVGIQVRLYEDPGSWSGSLLLPPEARSKFTEAVPGWTPCELLLEDGRSGTIVLINLGYMARFIGQGQLAAPTA